MIRVARPGLFTTVQDDGRWGYQRYGVPVAGPMDRLSHRLAKRLVGNRPTCATLEVTLVGPDLVFEAEALFAMTGAEFSVQLDRKSIAMNTVHAARPGQHLVFGALLRGARGYLGVAGGVDVPKVFGSRSTHVGSRLGGVDGRALVAGDFLAIGDACERTARPGDEHEALMVRPGDRTREGGAVVRLIPGPHDDRFGPVGIETLQSARYIVSVNSDRMGYRLSGPVLEPRTRMELLSAPVEMGAIQVPPSGEPIVLMADHQTTGGYPRIGTVITADLPVVAQLAPRAWIEFRVCDREDALRALVAQERRLMS